MHQHHSHLGDGCRPKANSGHPGTPMALAPVAYTLWQNFLRFDPDDPIWPNRDRFVLSNGHASMLLYACCISAGVKAVNAKYERLDEPAVTLDDIKRFRQIDSKCPGHPEYHLTSGVETTTGPLGQGCGNSVGMALAGRWLAQHFNRPDFTMFDYDVYAVCGDGDMMEGVASEAASFAGHQMLGNLCWIYDSNRITIEGHTDLAFSDDVAARFLAYGWNVQRVGDANDTERLAQAHRDLQANRRCADPDHRRQPYRLWRPAQARHQRGPRRAARRRGNHVSPSAATAGPRTPNSSCRTACASISRTASAGADEASSKTGDTLFKAYRSKYPDLADQIERMQRRELPDGWDAALPAFRRRRQGPCHARLLRQGAQRHCRALSLADRRLGRSRAIHQDASRHSKAPAIWKPARRAAAICTSASASMRWARS